MPAAENSSTRRRRPTARTPRQKDRAAEPVATAAKVFTVLIHCVIAWGNVFVFHHTEGTETVIACSLAAMHAALCLGLWGPRAGTLPWYWVPSPIHEKGGAAGLLLIGLLHFLGFGVMAFVFLEGWSIVDSFWFCFVLLTTVGYGNSFTPTTPGSRMFTVLWALCGLFIFGASTSLITDALSAIGPKLRNAFRKLRGADQVNGGDTATRESDDSSDLAYTPPDIYYVFTGLYINFVFFIVLNFGGSFVYVYVEDGWEYIDAMYHSLMTATTIGLGDIAPNTEIGRVYGIVHMVLSVTLFGSIIGTILSGLTRRSESMKKADMLKRWLDVDLITSLDKDGDGVDRFEFVIGMLSILGTVSEEDYMPFVEQFKKLDKTGDGKLTREDLIAAVDAKRQAVEAEEALKEGHGDLYGTCQRHAMNLITPAFIFALGFLWYALYGFLLCLAGLAQGAAVSCILGSPPFAARPFWRAAAFLAFAGSLLLVAIVLMIVTIIDPWLYVQIDPYFCSAQLGYLNADGSTTPMDLSKVQSIHDTYKVANATGTKALIDTPRYEGRWSTYLICLAYVVMLVYALVETITAFVCCTRCALNYRGGTSRV